MKTGIFVAAHDGLVSLVTGVGVVVNAFIEGFNQIKERSSMLSGRDIEFICLAPFLDRNSVDYNKKIRETTEITCMSNNGRLVDIPTFSDGSSQKSIWGGPEQWKSASLSVASHLMTRQSDYDSMLLLAHDTIFSSIRKYIPQLDKLQMVWIPHSLGLVFNDEYTDLERLSIEKESITSISRAKNDLIGYIGETSREVLEKGYLVNPKKLVPLINGLYIDSNRFKFSETERQENLRRWNIPVDKKIIFSWGRCVYQKGYDVLIPACKSFLEKNRDYHLVLLMPTETSTESYLEEIRPMVRNLPRNSVTAIYAFDGTLPYSLLRHQNLHILAFPSRFEGAPVTALEGLTFSNPHVQFIYSAISPLKNIFGNESRGICIKDFEVDSWNAGIIYAAKNRESLTKETQIPDIVTNYTKGIDIILEKFR